MILELEPEWSERPFLEWLPFRALPGPRLLWVGTYSHSYPRRLQLLHEGLSPSHRSFRPVNVDIKDAFTSVIY
jgi:hypothetical protein